jgi:hypothetical protein
MVPSVNRKVHYRSFGTPGGEFPPACRAATITEVGAWVTVETERHNPHYPPMAGDRRTVTEVWEPEACALQVSNPAGLFFDTACRHVEPDANGEIPGGTWHWPERVTEPTSEPTGEPASQPAG